MSDRGRVAWTIVLGTMLLIALAAFLVAIAHD